MMCCRRGEGADVEVMTLSRGDNDASNDVHWIFVASVPRCCCELVWQYETCLILFAETC